MNNEEIFRDFWASFKWPDSAPISRRLYYDDEGNPLMYSMEDHPGRYIEVTAEQYALSSMSVKIVDGKLIQLDLQPTFRKCRPSDHGTICHAKDITIVIDPETSGQRWRKR